MTEDREPDLRVICLGAGVQSTTLYLLAEAGEIGPKPDVAIFADTQAEPPWVYEHLDWLDANGSIPIHRATGGNLEEAVMSAVTGEQKFASVPFWVLGADGTRSPLRRQCTREYKIDVVKAEIRRILGLKKGQRAAGRYQVEEWVGISVDEAHRAKPSRYDWITSRWPLLTDKPMRRGECLRWLETNGYPIPNKSSCYFCPFHGNDEWRNLKDHAPDMWAEAVRLDKLIRSRGTLKGADKRAFLHPDLIPLDEVDLTDGGQMDLWGNECEGMCGV